MSLSLSATLKGLLTTPVNPASCSCARGLAVALTELASTSPALSGLASASAASAPAPARAPIPSLATWGSARASSAATTTTTATTTSSSGVERLKAELMHAAPLPPELAADGLATAHDELWRRRFAAALPL
jgi:hypothetical protein